MRGDVHEDGSRALLITRAEIERVNAAILDTGAKKLKAMQRSLEFRRGIAEEDWEHEVLRTRLNHLGTQLYYARMANVTREIREVLRRWKTGTKEDKTTLKMERNFEATRSNAEKVIFIYYILEIFTEGVCIVIFVLLAGFERVGGEVGGRRQGGL